MRIDFLSFADYGDLSEVPHKRTLIFGEMKTDGNADAKINEWISDYNSILRLSIQDIENMYSPRTEVDCVYLSLFWTDNKDKPQRIRSEFDRDESHVVRNLKPFGIDLKGSPVYLSYVSIGWNLVLFCLSNTVTFGRTTP